MPVGKAASESCFSQLPSVAFSPPSCSDAALFSNWMTNCCVCGLQGHESGVPTMRWKGVIGTTIAVSLLCFTPLDSAVYTVLTRETDTGTSVRLGLWRRKPHTPRRLPWRASARKLSLHDGPEGRPGRCEQKTALQRPPQKEQRSGFLELFLHEEGKSPH